MECDSYNEKDTDSLMNYLAVKKKYLSDYDCKIHDVLIN